MNDKIEYEENDRQHNALVTAYKELRRATEILLKAEAEAQNTKQVVRYALDEVDSARRQLELAIIKYKRKRN